MTNRNRFKIEVTKFARESAKSFLIASWRVALDIAERRLVWEKEVHSNGRDEALRRHNEALRVRTAQRAAERETRARKWKDESIRSREAILREMRQTLQSVIKARADKARAEREVKARAKHPGYSPRNDTAARPRDQSPPPPNNDADWYAASDRPPAQDRDRARSAPCYTL